MQHFFLEKEEAIQKTRNQNTTPRYDVLKNEKQEVNFA